MTDFLTDFQLAVISAIELSGLRMPRGMDLYRVSAEVLGIPAGECKQLRVRTCRTLDKGAVRCGYWYMKFILERRGTLVGLPSFEDLLTTEFDGDAWIRWLGDTGQTSILIDIWEALHPPEPQLDS